MPSDGLSWKIVGKKFITGLLLVLVPETLFFLCNVMMYA